MVFIKNVEQRDKFPIGAAVKIRCDGCAGEIPATVRASRKVQ